MLEFCGISEEEGTTREEGEAVGTEELDELNVAYWACVPTKNLTGPSKLGNDAVKKIIMPMLQHKKLTGCRIGCRGVGNRIGYNVVLLSHLEWIGKDIGERKSISTQYGITVDCRIHGVVNASAELYAQLKQSWLDRGKEMRTVKLTRRMSVPWD